MYLCIVTAHKHTLERSFGDAIVTAPENQRTMAATILLIDDNAVQAATRQTILKRAGYFVIPVLNPQRALQQFRENDFPAEIDLVITDHIMPGMNGSEFVTELRRLHPHLPVMVISGMDEAEEKYAGLDVLFRLKPLLPDHLLAAVDQMVHSPATSRHA